MCSVIVCRSSKTVDYRIHARPWHSVFGASDRTWRRKLVDVPWATYRPPKAKSHTDGPYNAVAAPYASESDR